MSSLRANQKTNIEAHWAMLKTTLKNLYYNSSDILGISDYLLKRTTKNNKLILTYHNVLPESEFTKYFTNNVDLTVDVFRKHIEFLISNYSINDISTITNPDINGFYLSFDDAMLNNIEIVAPILKEYGITAMFGACSSLVNGELEYLWRDEIFLILKNSIGKKILFPSSHKNISIHITGENINQNAALITNVIQQEGLMGDVYNYIKGVKASSDIHFNNISQLRYGHASLEDLRQLKKEGHLIASHTRSHKKLSYLSDGQQHDELRLSKEYFDKNIGETDHLVYPYGTFNEVNERSLNIAQEVGYNYAYMNLKNENENNHSISRLNLTNIKNESILKGFLARINRF